jgi:hypothetical protein
MKFAKGFLRLASVAFVIFHLAACAPEVGSEKWCDNLKEKPKGAWSANEAVEYAKQCIFK